MPEFESRLVVRNVDALDIDDPAQIRTYQLTDLEYQPPRLTLEAAQELTIVVEVSELDVECELNMNRYESERAWRDRARRSPARGRPGHRRAPPVTHA